MKKLLVTGASGFLGWNLCQEAQNDWKIYGTFFSHPVDIPGINVTRVDLTDFKELKRIFQEIHPDAVIHTAAATDPNYCQTNREISQKINVDVSVNIAGLCADYEVTCVFTSTDMVFDGLSPPYKEEDPVCPINLYGEQKALAEREMLKRCPSVAICRLPLMFGTPGPAASSFIQPMIKAMIKGKELRLFTDEFRTPISGRTASRGLLLAIEKINGIIHMGGIQRISRYDFGRLLRDVLGIHKARLMPCQQKDVAMAAPRPPDVSLDSSKAFAMGFKPPPLRVEVENLRDIRRSKS